jgi:hypothetical protein
MRSISSRGLAPASATSWLPVRAQVVQVNAETGCGECAVPGAAAEVGMPQGHAVRAGENQRIGFWAVKVSRCELTSATIREGIETVRLPASDLGGGEERLATGYLAALAGDTDGPAVTIDVGALESGQLAPPQAAEAGKEDERPVARANRVGQGVDLVYGQDWPFGRLLDRCALDTARVPAD